MSQFDRRVRATRFGAAREYICSDNSARDMNALELDGAATGAPVWTVKRHLDTPVIRWPAVLSAFLCALSVAHDSEHRTKNLELP
jgi:hypothetical protein